MEYLNTLYEWFIIFSQVVTIASIIAPLTTGWDGDDKFVAKMKPIVNAIALNFGGKDGR